ncbi:aminoglycoside phosphotransferase family protein [Umezawaea endophytica]|uniref:Aminoglycoside phosphotransferase family protein n=1 Tax=Umezawaea endophytica TaxID=1654476 RepID=A0A9X2VPC5_9PSEU|nr:aminoglycoside phosphotransferase family protein [Umezawaea endophytica]MCS7480139.1 aminoglycoside phosphotransferase family protein [Umezawaea endophytica]
MIEVPDLVRRKAESLGEPGERWLAALPVLVAAAVEEWALTLGPPFTGGSASYCASARTADGEAVVLKLVAPGHDVEGQVRTLAAANGRGYVHLLARSGDALLLEALGPPLSLPPERAIGVLARLLRRAWLPPDEPATSKAEDLAVLVDDLWRKHDRACSPRAYGLAMRCAERRAAPCAEVRVHGDPHHANTLGVPTPRPGAEEGYVFIDPEGFVADPAYDLGVVLRDWCAELLATPDPLGLARRYCALLADGSGLSATAIWEWGFLERVSSGLYLLDFAGPAEAAPFLRTADLLAGATLST